MIFTETLRHEDLRIIEEIVEKEIRSLRAYHTEWSYGRWKSLTRILDGIREAM